MQPLETGFCAGAVCECPAGHRSSCRNAMQQLAACMRCAGCCAEVAGGAGVSCSCMGLGACTAAVCQHHSLFRVTSWLKE